MNLKTIKTVWSEKDLKQNTYIIEEDEGCIIIDAGAPLSEVLKETDKEIVAVFITHGHFDHINYIEEYDKLNIPIYCHKLTAEFLTNSVYNASSLWDSVIFKVNNLKFVEDGDEISVLNKTIKCFSTPGHSSDGMCYLYDNKDLFSGDTLFSIAIGRTDLETANTQEMIESLLKIDNIPYVNLYAGHGRASTKEEQSKKLNYWINLLKGKEIEQ